MTEITTTSTLVYDIERRKPGAWITRAITHLALPPDKAMDNDSLNAISLLLAKLKETSHS